MPILYRLRGEKKALTAEIPVKTPKKKRKIEEKTVLLVKYGDKIAIRKRDDTGLLASLYEFRTWKENFPEKEVLEQMKCRAVEERTPGGKAYFQPCGMAYERIPRQSVLTGKKFPDCCLQIEKS